MCEQNYQPALSLSADINVAEGAELLNRSLLRQRAFVQVGRADYLMSGPCENEVIERNDREFDKAFHDFFSLWIRQSRAAFCVAGVANRNHVQRLPIISMVVHTSTCATIDTWRIWVKSWNLTRSYSSPEQTISACAAAQDVALFSNVVPTELTYIRLDGGHKLTFNRLMAALAGYCFGIFHKGVRHLAHRLGSLLNRCGQLLRQRRQVWMITSSLLMARM